ncbi:MAG TPA: tetratricopeptide repeat protein, partial [Candidatus Defluviicoccus seviourii]|nr:tetratricopeptide repeat protein [Candidatus Defluviicoccus seviourii]
NAFTYNGRAETLRDLGRFEEALAAYDEARQRFPDNAFTYTGRAETLRDLGRYRDAVDVYRETLNAFPANRVARNALACLLIENGDVDSGVALIANDAPRCKQDWIDYHVLAMADVKRGKYREAGSRLEYGAANCPSIKQRSVFTTTLAFVRVRQQKFEAAIELVGQLNNNVLPFHRPFAKVLEAHAEAECGRLKGATSAIGEARARGTSQVVTLANHIAKRYRLGDLAPPTMNPSEVEQLDAEIAEQEFALALRAA